VKLSGAGPCQYLDVAEADALPFGRERILIDDNLANRLFVRQTRTSSKTIDKDLRAARQRDREEAHEQVAGHADGIATIEKREDLPDMARFTLRTTRELARFIAAKGSVTLDGVSLTVNTVEDVVFSVLIIPHTLSVTTLNGWRERSEVNIEVDLMARYAARLSEMK